MGIFDSRKKTYVSSVVYNLAGPVEDRPEYLKSIVLGNMITQSRFSIADTIQTSYLQGPGMRLRSFHRWAKNHYKQVGIPKDTFMGDVEFNNEEIAAALFTDFRITAAVDWVTHGPADPIMWGRQWMRDNLPEKEALDIWTVDYLTETNEVMISFTDGTPVVVFTPVGYRPTNFWFYISYSRPILGNRWSTPKLLIYERGSGSSLLDVLMQTRATTGEYIPYIPIRHENEFLSEEYKPAVYAEAKKAFKKAIGSKYDELVEKIEENDDLDEIDFAYIMFGAPLNTKDMSSRRYIFEFFRHLTTVQTSNYSQFDDWRSSNPVTLSRINDWDEWRVFQQTVGEGDEYTEPPPLRPIVHGAPTNTIFIQDNGPGKTNFKIEIKWNSIVLSSGIGLAKPDAKIGEVWFTFAGSEVINLRGYTPDEAENLTIDTVEAYRQLTLNSWEKLTIIGMVHKNHIYNGKTVDITAAQALVDDDESGFIVPINYEVFREMSLIDATQMSTQCVNIVFNCYQIVKKKWYQTNWFKVFLFIVVIAIVVVTGGMAAGSVGLLGANAAIGISLGFAGLAATIAGAVANMVAAMVLTKLITYASVEILGEKIGLIVAAIASVIALNVGAALRAGQSMASIWSNMMNATNLLNLTNAVGNGYAQLIQSSTANILRDSQKALEDYRDQSLELQENYAEQFGYGTAVFDPMRLTEAGESFFMETAETFLSRTLLTGSDIAQMGNDMITNFVGLTLHNDFNED
jgi:hypothetical protein